MTTAQARKRALREILIALALALMVIVAAITGSYFFTIHAVEVSRCHNVDLLFHASTGTLHTAYAQIVKTNGCKV